MYIEFVIIFILLGILAVLQIVTLVMLIMLMKKNNSAYSSNQMYMRSPNNNYVNQGVQYNQVAICSKCGTDYSVALRCCPRCGNKR